MALVQDGVAPPLRRLTKALSNFVGSSDVDARHFGDCDTAKLEQAKCCTRPVAPNPAVDRVVLVGPLGLEIALAKAPTAILTTLDRDFEQLFPFGNDQVVLRLIAPY